MSDARLRDLERRYRATGDGSDGAAWIGERVREGGLEPQQIELAAYYGEPGCRAYLGADAPPEAVTLIEHCLVIHERQDACQRALIALAEATRPEWESAAVAHAALAAAKAFLRMSGDDMWGVIYRAKQASDDCARAMAADADAVRGGMSGGAFARAAAAPWGAALCVGRGGELSARFLSEAATSVVAHVDPAREPELIAAIRQDLIAWALGEEDQSPTV